MKNYVYIRMKRISLVVFLFASILSASAKSQDYRPFIEDGKVWVSGMYGQVYPSDNIQYYIVYDFFDGDTIVSGVKCKRWIERFEPRDEPDQEPLVYTMAVYEENGKVWLFHEGECTPRLIYDFMAEPGDAFVVYSALAYSFQWAKNRYGNAEEFFKQAQDSLTILSRKEEFLGGRTQRVIYYSSQRPFSNRRESFYDCIIEGVGSIRGPFDNLAYGGTSPVYLVYCMKGSDLLYFNDVQADYWKIPLPTSVTFPSSPSPSTLSTHTWADLSGRRLTTPPTRPGLYIKDGRKVMVK